VSPYAAVVWLHVLAAAVWIGSMVFFALIVVPVVRRAADPAAAPRLLRAMGNRFRTLGWVALGVLVTTGVANLHFRGITLDYLRSREFWSTLFGRALAYKLVFVAAAIALTAVHEILTPKDPAAPVSARRRRLTSWSGRLILVVSLGVLYFAVALVRGLV